MDNKYIEENYIWGELLAEKERIRAMRSLADGDVKKLLKLKYEEMRVDAAMARYETWKE